MHLPDELLLIIFEYLPGKVVHSVLPQVCKKFRIIVYGDQSQLLRKAIPLVRKIYLENHVHDHLSRMTNILNKLLQYVESLTLADCRVTWDDFCAMVACNNLKILNIAHSNITVPDLVLQQSSFIAENLVEINLCNCPGFNDTFLSYLTRCVNNLHTLNISRTNVTDKGFTSSTLDLTVLNISLCRRLTVASVIHAVNAFGCTVVCFKGMDIDTKDERHLLLEFPDALGCQIPSLCGFDKTGFVCFYCQNSVSSTFIDLETVNELYYF